MAKTNNKSAKAASAKKAKSSSSPSRRRGTGAPQKILDFCLYLETRSGDPNVSRKQIAAMAGVKSNTFPVTLSGLKKKGLIDYPDSKTICLTDQGRAQANPITEITMPDNSSAQEEVKKKFKIAGGSKGALFEALLDGRAHDREDLVERRLGMKKSSSAELLSNLKKQGVIDYGPKTIQLTDLCFPFGRPFHDDEEDVEEVN